MKGLIRHEIRNVRAVFAYMMVAISLWVYLNYSAANRIYYDAVDRGYETYSIPGIGKIMGESNIIWYMMLMSIGIIILLYMQFRDNKSMSVSDFMKSLPYTNEQIAGVKLGVGVTTITIPLIIATGFMIPIIKSLNPITRIYSQISPLGEQITYYNSVGYLLKGMLLIYSVTIAVYLIGFLSQYLINRNIASIVTGFGAIFAVPGIMWGWLSIWRQLPFSSHRYSSGILTSIYERITDISIKLFIPAYFLGEGEWVYYREEGGAFVSSTWIRTFGNIEGKLIIMGLLIVILLLVIYSCARNYQAETQESFSSYRAINNLFIAGVTLSAVSLWGLINEVFFYNSHVILLIGMLVSGIAGYIISRKIAKR